MEQYSVLSAQESRSVRLRQALETCTAVEDPVREGLQSAYLYLNDENVGYSRAVFELTRLHLREA